MLTQLSIHNVAIVDKLSIEFFSGLNIMTGETGAGKSIIIDSIGAILGERVTREMIRTGSEKAIVEAIFQQNNEKIREKLEELGIEPEEDGTLIVTREFTTSGKNHCRINGRMITVTQLREIGNHLIDVHGQHDNQSLLYPHVQIKLLDSFGGKEIETLKRRYRNELETYKAIKKQIEDLSGDRKERERKIDLLTFQIEEIRKAKLKAGEDGELEKQRLLLLNAEKLVSSLSSAYEILYEGNTKNAVIDGINEVMKQIQDLIKIDPDYRELYQGLEGVYYQLDDIAASIRNKRDEVEFNPGLLEEIEERLDLIYRLKKKYGSTVQEILDYCAGLEAELESVQNSEEKVEELVLHANQSESRLLELAENISRLRQNAAGLLQSKIEDELEDLEMKKARFKVSLEQDSSRDEMGNIRFTQEGLDSVEFLISTNIGEPLKPLSKIASGGEMSRIMLAIKTILADVDEMPTMIFDEIDIGISGKAAQKVGEKLKIIAEKHQVISVTHLAQIACMADEHYLIEKISTNEATHTEVHRLKKEARVDELARILGGARISEITRKHAEEMIHNAGKVRA